MVSYNIYCASTYKQIPQLIHSLITVAGILHLFDKEQNKVKNTIYDN